MGHIKCITLKLARCVLWTFPWVLYNCYLYIIVLPKALIKKDIHNFRFPPPTNWPPRYNWNIIESGVDHNNHNPTRTLAFFWHSRYSEQSWFINITYWVLVILILTCVSVRQSLSIHYLFDFVCIYTTYNLLGIVVIVTLKIIIFQTHSICFILFDAIKMFVHSHIPTC